MSPRNATAPVLFALFAALALAPAVALAQTQTAAWSQDQEIDLMMGAFEDDPSLLRVMTERPDDERRLELRQPFDQEPEAALGDFSAPGDTVICIPNLKRFCP